MPVFDPAIVSEVPKEKVSIAVALKLDFPSGPLRVWTGRGDIVHDGATYGGSHEFTGVNQFVQTLDQSEASPKISTIADFSKPFVVDGRDGTAQGREAIADIVFLNSETLAVLGYVRRLHGFIDNTEIDGDILEITLTDESAKLRRTTSQTLTDGVQQALFPEVPGDPSTPADRGLEYATNPFDTKFGGARTTGIPGGGLNGRELDDIR